MPKYVAFLRAINVGGHTVKMEHLRSLFETLGFSNVETFIASGNVIFNSTAVNTKTLEKNIETHLLEQLGYQVATFLRSTSELAAIARHKPFSDVELSTEGHTLYVGFLREAPSEEARQVVLSKTTPVDDFSFHERELYWLLRTRFSESQFKGNLEKTLEMQLTLRNATTVRKIAAKYGGDHL